MLGSGVDVLVVLAAVEPGRHQQAERARTSATPGTAPPRRSRAAPGAGRRATGRRRRADASARARPHPPGDHRGGSGHAREDRHEHPSELAQRATGDPAPARSRGRRPMPTNVDDDARTAARGLLGEDDAPLGDAATRPVRPATATAAHRRRRARACPRTRAPRVSRQALGSPQAMGPQQLLEVGDQRRGVLDPQRVVEPHDLDVPSLPIRRRWTSRDARVGGEHLLEPVDDRLARAARDRQADDERRVGGAACSSPAS